MSILPRTLGQLAVLDPLPKGAYVNLPDNSSAWLVESVQVLPDGFRVNNQSKPIFSGDEAVNHYFDVRSFAGVMREILIHLMNTLSGDRPATQQEFWKAQEQVAKLRKRLERAYQSAHQKGETDLQVWMIGLEAYVLIVEDGQRLDDVMRLSLGKLAKHALKRGRELDAEKGAMTYFYDKR